jgi:protein gp37
MIGWVIVGGESGPGARPCDVDWIRSIVAQCRAAGVPAFVKQLGSRPRWGRLGGDLGTAHQARAAGGISDSKGKLPEEWPEDLRVREWPEASS